MDRSPPPARVRALRRRLLDHYDHHRRDLPWRRERDPYRIWVSEVILQQTRVETAIPFYRRWMERFPTLEALALSDAEAVMSAWCGLGYYRRARDLHRAARIVRDRLDGRLPGEAAALAELPGIGPYTAGAVASIAFGRREPAIDGNARRVLVRLFDLERPSEAGLARLARALVPADRPGDFNQALMELGATLCRPRRPRCPACPLEEMCLARCRDAVAERPPPRPRKDVPEFTIGTAVLSSARGRVLLVKRPEEGLLGGMWEFPGVVARQRETPGAAARRAARRLLGPQALSNRTRSRAFALVPHAFSHRRHVYHAFHFRLAEEMGVEVTGRSGAGEAPAQGIPAWTAAAWVPLADVRKRALPAAQLAIACVLDL